MPVSKRIRVHHKRRGASGPTCFFQTAEIIGKPVPAVLHENQRLIHAGDLIEADVLEKFCRLGLRVKEQAQAAAGGGIPPGILPIQRGDGFPIRERLRARKLPQPGCVPPPFGAGCLLLRSYWCPRYAPEGRSPPASSIISENRTGAFTRSICPRNSSRPRQKLRRISGLFLTVFINVDTRRSRSASRRNRIYARRINGSPQNLSRPLVHRFPVFPIPFCCFSYQYNIIPRLKSPYRMK